MPSRHALMNGRERALFGCTVTFENADGNTLSGHRTGSPLAGLAELCDAALELDPSYRVVSYSTPQTIYADLKGREIGGGVEYKSSRVTGVEITVHSKIGRREMLHPRLTLAADA